MKVSTKFWILRSLSAVAFLTISNVSVTIAQTAADAAVLSEFPANALPLKKQELDERLRGNVFAGKTPTGAAWRADYKDSGYVFVNMDNGARDSGTWRVEDGKLCVEYRARFPSGCSEVRGSADALYSMREDGKTISVMRKQ